MNLKVRPYFLLSCATIFIISWFYFYFTTAPLPSVDLPTFIHSVEALKQVWWKGGITFYDRTNFTGWVPFQFYPFLPGLLAALVSYPLDLFTDHSVRLSAHILLVLGSSLLPWLFYYVALPLLRESSGIEPTDKEKTFLALTATVFGFWFLNHDHQWYGLGAASVMHIGLFSQLYGWIFLLLFFGALLRAISTPSRSLFILSTTSLCGLVLSHLLTFVFAAFVCSMFFILKPIGRRVIALSFCLGVLLSSFWFLPMLVYMGEYTSFDIYRPKGDFLELFFRYPLYSLLNTARTISGFSSLNPIYLITPFLILYLLASSKVRKDSNIFLLFLTTVIGVVIFNSGFVASSLAIGLHYYRFNAYLFLLLTVILVPIPALLTKRSRSSRAPFIAVLLLLSLGATIVLPHYERDLIRDNSTEQYLANEDQIVKYFSALPKKGRIYNEYITDYKKFAPLSAHILSQRLVENSGFEVVTNSHVQESIAYRMLVVSANLLGAKTYNAPLLFTDRASLDDQTKIEQLRSFGITHIIAGRDSFAERVEKFALEPEVKFGRYRIFKIGEPSQVSPSTKRILGYIDLSGELPFKFVQYYFYARKELKNFELLALRESDLSGFSKESLPVDGFLVNMPSNNTKQDETKRKLGNLAPLYELSYDRVFSFDHYNVRYQHNMELDQYNEAEKYLSAKTLHITLEKAFPEERSDLPTIPAAEVLWSDDSQSVKITGLVAGTLYHLNYSYFPFWRAEGADIYRGSGERIFLLPKGSEVTLKFSRYYAPSTWFGILLSVLGVWLLRRRGLDNLLRLPLGHKH